MLISCGSPSISWARTVSLPTESILRLHRTGSYSSKS